MTKFAIGGRPYGGLYDASQDVRVEFLESTPTATTILELGSLEGGHSFVLARHPRVTRLVALDGRPANVEKARFVQSLLEIENIEFEVADLEVETLGRYGTFEAVYCVGLLYHLPEPWRLIEQISLVTDRMFLWTVHAPLDSSHVDFAPGSRPCSASWRLPSAHVTPLARAK